jgi:zinc protease
MRVQGPFTAGLDTRNDQAPEAIKVLRQVLRDFVANGPTETELKAAKKNITGGFALRLDSNAKIAQYLATIGFYELPLDYLDTFNQKVEAVTVAQIRDAFTRRIDPDHMVTVIVGADAAAAQ